MKQVTLKDIAKEAGVSITAVSKALAGHPDISEATKLRIREICDRRNYIPNANAAFLRRRRTNLIGVVVPDFSNPFFAEMLKNVERVLTERGFSMLIFNTNDEKETERRCINELRGIHVEGILITPASEQNLKLIRDAGIAYVVAARPVDDEESSVVAADEEYAAYLATNEILVRNEDANCYLLGPREEIHSFRKKIVGYRRALSEHGTTEVEASIINNVYSNRDGYEVAGRLLADSKLPIAFLCESDFIAIGVVKRLSEEGVRIPEQAVVIGMDNLEIFDYARPLLTTVDIQTEVIAQKSVELLLRKIEHRGTPSDPEPKKEGASELRTRNDMRPDRIILEPHVVSRETS